MTHASSPRVFQAHSAAQVHRIAFHFGSRSNPRTNPPEKGLTAGTAGAEKLGELPGDALDVAQLIRERSARQSRSTDTSGGFVLNAIFIALIVGAVMTAAYNGTMPAVNQALFDSAKYAVNIAIGLIGTMALWLGFMRVLRDAGVMANIARAIAPIMHWLFPAIPRDHPAISAMILNMSANMLGLGNAATPFGLKAMQELQKMNANKAVATDAMALFLAINTAGIAVIPVGAMAVRESLNSANPGAIFFPSILATLCSTITAIIVAKSLARLNVFSYERSAAIFPEGAKVEESDLDEIEVPETNEARSLSRWGLALMFAVFAWAIAMIVRDVISAESGTWEAIRDIFNSWLMPLLAVGIALFGLSARVKVYDSLIEGAREGFQIVVMIIPFLVAILVAIGVFQASGALDLVLTVFAPVTSLIGFPVEALPMAIMRPLSGQGALGVMTATMQTYGPDSFIGYLVSVISGSTETTFYVLALYCGSIRLRATRHAVFACIAADIGGALAALFWCRVFF
jgi:spore maturation protein SpmA